jgi:hypothetical protein
LIPVLTGESTHHTRVFRILRPRRRRVAVAGVAPLVEEIDNELRFAVVLGIGRWVEENESELPGALVLVPPPCGAGR